MAYDSAATKARLLDAAYTEFSERGVAGARVARIAAAAAANKQAIYLYFGSKDGLFDAMLAQRLEILADTVPFTPDDLPGYTAALFDALQENPELVRLTQWAWLERADDSAAEIGSHREKAAAIAAIAGGSLSEERAMDIFILVVTMCTGWTTTATGQRAIGNSDPAARTASHRAALVTAVTAVVDALTHPA
jgi:AcrR family transcriptional regulator